MARTQFQFRIVFRLIVRNVIVALGRLLAPAMMWIFIRRAGDDFRWLQPAIKHKTRILTL